MDLPPDSRRADGNVLPYRLPGERPPWSWLLFLAGGVAGFVAVVVIGIGLAFIYTSAYPKPPVPLSFYGVFLLILAAVTYGNLRLERRRFRRRGYGAGLLISLSLNALCFGLCASSNFNVGPIH